MKFFGRVFSFLSIFSPSRLFFFDIISIEASSMDLKIMARRKILYEILGQYWKRISKNLLEKYNFKILVVNFKLFISIYFYVIYLSFASIIYDNRFG